MDLFQAPSEAAPHLNLPSPPAVRAYIAVLARVRLAEPCAAAKKWAHGFSVKEESPVPPQAGPAPRPDGDDVTPDPGL